MCRNVPWLMSNSFLSVPVATVWSISKTSACRALWERIGSSQNPICGWESHELSKQQQTLLLSLLSCFLFTHRCKLTAAAAGQSLLTESREPLSSGISHAKRDDRKGVICLSLTSDTHITCCWTSAPPARAKCGLQRWRARKLRLTFSSPPARFRRFLWFFSPIQQKHSHKQLM